MVGEGGEGEREAAARGRFAFAAVCLLALAPLLGGCGLEEYVVLEPPINQSSGSQILFLHNQDNQTSFNGYMVVYRLYSSQDKASAAAGVVESSWSSTTPDIIVNSRLSKFKSIIIDDHETSPPTISIPSPNKAIEVSLPLTPAGLGSITVDGIENTITVRRNSKDGTAFRTFGDLSPDEDCDYSEERLSAYVLAYGFAYGFESTSSTFRAVYSEPIRLILAELVSSAQ